MTFVSVPENDFSKPFSLQEREQRNKIKDGPLLQEVTCIHKHLLVKKDYGTGRVRAFALVSTICANFRGSSSRGRIHDIYLKLKDFTLLTRRIQSEVSSSFHTVSIFVAQFQAEERTRRGIVRKLSTLFCSFIIIGEQNFKLTVQDKTI